MFTLSNPQENEIEICRSRFITALSPAITEEQARAHIIDTRKRFPDARHHCSAFIVQPDTTNTYSAIATNSIERSNDDGEPSGTAGQPMLQALKAADLTQVSAVVTRYFGGIKLGTGGLVRAYSQSITQAIAQAHTHKLVVELIQKQTATLVLSHDLAGKIQSQLRYLDVDITACTYDDSVHLELAFAPECLSHLRSCLNDWSKGNFVLQIRSTILAQRALA